MNQQTLQVSEEDKRILETMRVEFFPILQKLKDILVRVQKSKVFWQLYSSALSDLKKEYIQASSDLFEVNRKLTTMDILFEGLDDKAQVAQSYFRYKVVINQSLNEASNYIEMIDRTIDRKEQGIYNARTLLLAAAAVVVGVFGL